MGQEIERKFLVAKDSWQAQVTSSSQIQQGYLSASAKATVRIRIFDGKRAVLTLKGKAEGLARPEFEYEVPLADAEELMQISRPETVEKRRHRVPHGKHVWEVDVFEGHHAGLIVAEVEMRSEDEEVALPDWVGKEVTEDERYANASLARTPGVPQ